MSSLAGRRRPPWTAPAGGDATEGSDWAPQLQMEFGRSPAVDREMPWWGTAAEGARRRRPPVTGPAVGVAREGKRRVATAAKQHGRRLAAASEALEQREQYRRPTAAASGRSACRRCWGGGVTGRHSSKKQLGQRRTAPTGRNGGGDLQQREKKTGGWRPQRKGGRGAPQQCEPYGWPLAAAREQTGARHRQGGGKAVRNSCRSSAAGHRTRLGRDHSGNRQRVVVGRAARGLWRCGLRRSGDVLKSVA